MMDLTEIKSRINPQYQDVLGTESHERKWLCDEIDRLRQICRNAYEVWAGSEGIPEPATAPEAYLLQLLTQMKDEIREGLK